jgi:hypothetical protein
MACAAGFHSLLPLCRATSSRSISCHSGKLNCSFSLDCYPGSSLRDLNACDKLALRQISRCAQMTRVPQVEVDAYEHLLQEKVESVKKLFGDFSKLPQLEVCLGTSDRNYKLLAMLRIRSRACGSIAYRATCSRA